MKIFHLCVIVSYFFLSGCTFNDNGASNPHNNRTMQTRIYPVSHQNAFSGTISALVGLGYTITHTDGYTGLIQAEQFSKNPLYLSDQSYHMLNNSQEKTLQQKVTALIENTQNGTAIRLSFVDVKYASTSIMGQSQRYDAPAIGTYIYQEAFNRIENTLFAKTN